MSGQADAWIRIQEYCALLCTVASGILRIATCHLSLPGPDCLKNTMHLSVDNFQQVNGKRPATAHAI